MTKKEAIQGFDPNGVGTKNGNFIALPFDEQNAQIVLFPVPWDVTTSYADGTATGPQNILEASSQLDLYDPVVSKAWEMGIFMRASSEKWLTRNAAMRKKAKRYIDALERGEDVKTGSLASDLVAVNEACESLKNWVYLETSNLLDAGKLVGLVGGEHSVPLGFLEALSERYTDFGVLHLDAHFDLRNAYEGFPLSHASIFYNALKIKEISKFVHVGIRDFCEAEVTIAAGKRHKTYYDHRIKEGMFDGITWRKMCKKIVKQLPKNVYISFDIDSLDPHLCPNTGTPVPGGLGYQEAMYLLGLLVLEGKKIIGFDLSEVAGVGHEWDGNVGARVLYRLCNLMGASQGKN